MNLYSSEWLELDDIKFTDWRDEKAQQDCDCGRGKRTMSGKGLLDRVCYECWAEANK
jgi:hypothetical protein